MSSTAVKSKRQKLIEQSFSDHPDVDREAGVIKNVKVLGAISKNGREYSRKALQDGCRILEGAKVNIDHNRENPKRERGFMESIGSIHGLKLRDDGIYADEFRIKKTHPNAGVVFESAERFPRDFGLSINAEGNVAKHGGKWVVESIESAQSVDLVSNPATTNGLFESESIVVKKTLREIIEEKGTTEHKSRLKKLIEDDDMSSAADDQSDMTEDYPDAEVGDAVSSAFDSLILAVLHNDKLDASTKKTQVSKLIDMCDELMNGPSAAPETEGDAGSSDAGDEGKIDESVKAELKKLGTALQESVASQNETRAELRLMKANIKPTPERIQALCGAKNEAAKAALLESWPEEQKTVAKPRYSPPAESSGVREYPKDLKAFANQVKS